MTTGSAGPAGPAGPAPALVMTRRTAVAPPAPSLVAPVPRRTTA
ncbi:hypothetical protein [Cellulomonas endophytica]|nr:hypothetical protein [Cellulomonas endophytica]